MNRLLRRGFERALAANSLGVRLANNAFDRMFRPGELVQSNRTPFDIIHRHDLVSVRHYRPLEESSIRLADGTQVPVCTERRPVPVVMVPPLAASSVIFDLLPQRSLVRYLLARGYDVYLIDWGEPELDHSHLGLKDYTGDMLPRALQAIRADAGIGEVSLFGWCMGGLFALIHAGLSGDKQIRNIITVASPVDSRAGGIAGRLMGALNGPARLVRKYTNFRVHDLDPKTLQVPGWLNALAFKLTNPVGSLMSYWDLLTRLWDREFLETHTTTARFLNNMMDYPGGIVQDFFVRVGVDNELSRGRITVGDQESSFDRIECSLLVYAGQDDAIVTPAAAHRVMDLVRSRDKEFVVAPGGHMGVFAGSRAPAQVWATAADWLWPRSGEQRVDIA